jgi:hypothetical protein
MKIESYGFSKDELETIKICMTASCMEKFFPEWEFQSLFGIERDELKQAVSLFPNLNYEDDIHNAAIKGSLGHLLGYPHGRDRELEVMLNKDVMVIKKVLDKFNQ